MSEERLRRFFVQEGDHYRVRRELRDMVLFAAHNLLKDPPFSRIDLVSCRNLLIYLDRELQQQVCSTFHYALNPNGFLLLGSSEMVDNPPGLFRTIDRKARIYQSTARPGDRPRLLPPLLGGAGLHEHYVGPGRPLAPSAALNEAVLHRQAIEKVAPPSVLVDGVASGGAPVGACRTISAAVGRPAQRRRGRSGAAGAAVRAALGIAPRLRARAVDAQPADPDTVQRRAASGPSSGQAGRRGECGRPAPRAGAVHRGRAGRGCAGHARPAGRNRRDRAAAARRAGAHPGAAADHARGVGIRQRGAARRQRGAAIDQRGVPLDLRGAGDQQGGAAVDQRGAADRQCRAQAQARRGLARGQRSAEPDGGHRLRHAVSRCRPAHQAVHQAGDRPDQDHAERRGAADLRLRAAARIRRIPET